MRSLDLLEKDLSDEIVRLSDDEKRERCLAVCRLAIERVGLNHHMIEVGMSFLKRGMYGDQRVISDLERVVEDLDGEYFDTLERYKAGQGDEETYQKLFERARVANAVLVALDRDPTTAIEDAIYEASCALHEEEIAAFLKHLRLSKA